MKIGGFPNEASFVFYLIRYVILNKKDILFILEDDADVEKIYEISLSLLQIFNADMEIIKFDSDRDNIRKGIEKIYSSQKLKFIVASVKSVNTGFPDKKNLSCLSLKVSSSIKRYEIIEKLVSAGFIKVSFVENSGQFATRGSVVDIFDFGMDYPYRLYFDSERIESIRKFDIETQNTFDFEMEVNISALNRKEKTLLNMNFERFSTVEDLNIDAVVLKRDFDFRNIDYFENIKFLDFGILKSDIEKFSRSGFDIYIFSLNERESSKIYGLFEENNILSKKIKFLCGYIDRGFFSKDEKTVIISSNEIFLREYDFNSIKRKRKVLYRLSELEAGDLVVYEDYGIGIFRGIKDLQHRDEWGNIYISECIEIEYAKGEKLFISLDDFKKIHKYVGASREKVKISSLGSAKWKNIRERIKKEIVLVAKDIIKLEAKRKALRIKPMIKTEMEDDFETDFIYDETPDQSKAISDVLTELESGNISNRVIVGDVGFGKTEVAMRAAFRAVSNGWQCCVLCPTTILAQQHYRNFKKRFEKYNINVDVLSRLTPYSKEKEIVSDISKGVVDIIIGTHKLLSKDIKFKNLGLVVVDEEHKFGVKQKEEIKKKQNLAHLLYLSATPIPRTLYQSLSSIRSMSVIETPPIGRLPVETKVGVYNENMIISAVNNEIRRGGQIYYVYNRVEFINDKLEKLSKLLPGIKIAVVHGKMDKERIEDVMMDFIDKKYDILLSSTIIDSGIDIPSVNTLIVEDAHKLGLAQLYQLRGRIGREKNKAYCYLFFPKWFEKGDNNYINSDMMKRLFALEEFSELGSGFRLAMRDLEIRGAGELLGTKQHGFITAVGLDMYIKLLDDEIKKIKGESIEIEENILIDLKLTAMIPANYIEDDLERLNFYKRLYSADLEEIEKIVDRMRDLAGAVPKEVLNLINILKIKKLLKGKGVMKIEEKENKIEFYFSKEFNPSNKDIIRWQKRFKDDIRFFKTSNGDGFEVKIDNNDRIDIIKEVFLLKWLNEEKTGQNIFS